MNSQISHDRLRNPNSFVLTDVASGWTECIALPVREQALIVEAIDGLRATLPFPVLGIDTENDSAFLNDTLFTYCNDQGMRKPRARSRFQSSISLRTSPKMSGGLLPDDMHV